MKNRNRALCVVLSLSLLCSGMTVDKRQSAAQESSGNKVDSAVADASGTPGPTAAVDVSGAPETTAAADASASPAATVTAEVSATPEVPSDGSVIPMPIPTGATVDVTQIKISKIKAVIMVGKTTTPVISGTNSPVTWTSSDETVATVDETGKVKGVKVGKVTITASMDGVMRICTVTVVARMSKNDFSKFNSENFVSYCQRHRYNNGFAWNGQWKGGSKKKKTTRGITIGSAKSKITDTYGELSWKKCSAKDPFTKMKGLKKNKVKTYADAVWNKYRIRFYLNSKKKVVAIIFACNISKIKKRHLRKYM